MEAVAVFKSSKVEGRTEFYKRKNGVMLRALFTKLPSGRHGFHIHKAGDLTGEGCKGACDHWHKGRPISHGGPPTSDGPRHTGDLGNVYILREKGYFYREYFLRDVSMDELYGRSLIVHEDEDDYGLGGHADSTTTGHSGARIACAIIGRAMPKCEAKNSTRKNKKN